MSFLSVLTIKVLKCWVLLLINIPIYSVHEHQRWHNVAVPIQMLDGIITCSGDLNFNPLSDR